MVAEFLSVIVDLCSGQSDPTWRLVLNSAPTNYQIKNTALDCQCQDDGCLIWSTKNAVGDWRSAGLFSNCLIEVKPIVKAWNESDEPEIETRLLAQHTCEILGALLAHINRKGTNTGHFDSLILPHFFLVSVRQTSLSLLHTEFTKPYLEYFLAESDSPAIDSCSKPEPEFLTITQSRIFDLARTKDRKAAAEMFVALCRFLMTHRPGTEREDGEEEDEED